MDGHVDEQHMLHLIAEAAEVGAEVEVGVERGQRADLAGLDQIAIAHDVVEIAPVLDHGVGLAGVGCRLRPYACASAMELAIGFSPST